MSGRWPYMIMRIMTGIRHWGVRRLTPLGLLLLVGLAVSAVFGLDTNLTLAYQMFCFLLALFMVALAVSLVRVPPLTARRIMPRFGTVGEALTYRIVLANPENRPLAGLAIFEDLPDPRPSLDEFRAFSSQRTGRRGWPYDRWLRLIQRRVLVATSQAEVPSLPPRGEAEVRVELTPIRRGRLELSSLTVARPDPCGLLRRPRTIPAPGRLLILPKRYPVPAVALPGTRRYQPGGVSMAMSVGDSEEFISMRDYRPGDPLRRIHWKSWAKTEKPIVKEYQDEYFVRHALILDTFVTDQPDEVFEEAVSLAASYAANVLTQDSLLDLMFVGDQAYCFTSGRGLAHTDRMLEILAAVGPCPDRPIDTLTPLILGRAAMLAACICVLIDWDQNRQDLVGRLTSLNLPLKVLVVRPPGSPPLDPGPMRVDPANFHQIEVGRVEEGLAS